MQNVDKIIDARWIVPIRPANHLLEHHSLVVDQHKIIAILPIKIAHERYQAHEHIRLDKHLLMPGMINAHTHMGMNLFRGLGDDLPLMDWLNDHVWPAEATFINKETVPLGVELAIAEMIRSGTTCFNDMYFFPNVSAEVVARLGMRGALGLTYMNVPTGWAKDEAEYHSKAQAAYAQRIDNELIQYVVSPQGPYTNSDSSLLKAKSFADAFNLPMQIHLHETQAELDIEQQSSKQRPFARLDKLGLLNDRFIAIHMVHLNDEEIARAAKLGVSTVHCPESNMKLASGTSPVCKLLNNGVNVALGTDGAASNNDLDMFGEMRTAAFLAKAIGQDPTLLPAFQALELATINGAKALGIANKVGSLEVGKQADVIAIELDHLFTQPAYNPISHLVYAVSRTQVSHVWVNGEALLKNGELTRINVDKLLAKAAPWFEKIKAHDQHKG